MDDSASAVTAVTYIGHGTVLIEADGTRLLTDPVLGRRVAHLRRLTPVPALERLVSPDAVLISHAHRDHLDLASLRRLSPSVLAVVPRGWGRLAGRAGLREVTEVSIGDRVRVGSVEVLATPAEHDGRRVPLGRAASALGYVVEGSRRVYFAGDTDVFDGMRELVDDLDVALLPVSGWGSRLPRGHMDPERAAHATALLRPRLAVPIHWGTLAMAWASPSEPERPAREFARLVSTQAPDVSVRVLRPGERLTLDSS